MHTSNISQLWLHPSSFPCYLVHPNVTTTTKKSNTALTTVRTLTWLTPTLRSRSPTIFMAVTRDEGVIALPLISPVSKNTIATFYCNQSVISQQFIGLSSVSLFYIGLLSTASDRTRSAWRSRYSIHKQYY